MDAQRRFIFNYHLEDDSIAIFEVAVPNSGHRYCSCISCTEERSKEVLRIHSIPLHLNQIMFLAGMLAEDCRLASCVLTVRIVNVYCTIGQGSVFKGIVSDEKGGG